MATIAEAIAAKKGDIIATAISAGDLTSGTTNGNDWSRKKFTFDDGTGQLEITLWGEDVKKVEIGKRYSFEKLYWKEYQGTLNVSPGKYGKITEIPHSPSQQPQTEQQTQQPQTEQQTQQPQTEQQTQQPQTEQQTQQPQTEQQTQQPQTQPPAPEEPSQKDYNSMNNSYDVMERHTACLKIAKYEAHKYFTGRHASDKDRDIVTQVFYKSLMSASCSVHANTGSQDD